MVGWVERKRNPSPLAGLRCDGLRFSQPIQRIAPKSTDQSPGGLLLRKDRLANVRRANQEVFMRRELLAELLQLNPTERLELIGDLWDSLEPDDLPPLGEDQIQEMERRLAEHRADPDSAVSWEEVRAELRSRFG